jgi:competence protein ComEC
MVWGEGLARRPLCAGCVTFAAGAFAGLSIGQRAAALAAAASFAGALLVWALVLAANRVAFPRLRAGLGLAAALICAGALGLARGAAAPRPAEDAAVFRWLDDAAEAKGGREPLLAEGQVLSADPARGGARVLLRIDLREPLPGEPLAAPPAPLLAQLYGPRGLHRGDRIRALLRLRRPPRALNPGAQDARAQLALRGIALVGSIEPDGLRVLSRGPALPRALDELRARFASRCEEVCTTPQRAALVAALGVGDRSGIDPALDDELAESGLVHLLSSAGLHLAVVALAVRALLRRLLLATSLAPRALQIATLAALPAALGEALLLGAPWPALRAAWGAALGLCAPALSRRADSLTALALAAAACSAFDPASTHDLALQLSLLGVLGLVVLSGPLRELLPIPRPPLGSRSLPRLCAEELVRLCCATAAATLCTAPLLAFAFHRVSLVSIAANALGLWPGLAAVPVATLAIPLGALSPALALPLFWAADALAGAVLLAARAFAALPHAVVWVAAPGAWVVALWICFAVLLAGLPARTAQARPRPRIRLLRAAIPLSILCAIAIAQKLRTRFSQTLTATFLAVGQGDAAVVQLPGGRVLLIDAGGDLRGLPAPLGPGLRDPGARDLLPALAELGVSRVDVAVLTHPHPDHAGGLPTLLSHLPVGELWATGEVGPGDIGPRLEEAARARGVPVRTPPPGTSLELGGVRIEVLAPAPRWSARRSTNDNSIVLRLVHGAVALLFPGDVEALAEAQLAQGPAPLAAQLLKAPHHGSRTSSTDAFLRRVRPAAVVYSVGEGNPFGFPHPDVVARARALGATALLRTDQGAIQARSDGLTLHLSQFVPGQLVLRPVPLLAPEQLPGQVPANP